MKNLCVLFSIFVLISCKSKKEHKCFSTAEILVGFYGDRVFGTHESNGRIDEFRDKGVDSVVGGYYRFYPSGIIKSYQFFVDTAGYVYQENFDSAGQLEKAVGNIIVRRTIFRPGEDSLEVKFYVFTLQYQVDSLLISINKGKWLSIPLKVDTLFSNMKSGSVGYNFEYSDTTRIRCQVNYTEKCSKSAFSATDTICLETKRQTSIKELF